MAAVSVQANSSPDYSDAERKLSLSKKLSIAGLVIGIVFIIVWNVLRFTVFKHETSESGY